MFLTVAGKRIHYQIGGEGPPVLFVHGWGGTIQSLLPLSQLFPRNKTILLDLPGFGRSDLPDNTWGTKEYGELLYNFTKLLGIEKLVYFGHSFGGALGVYLAHSHPSLISKLILCSASYRRTAGSIKGRGEGLKKLPLPAPVKLAIRKIIYRIFYPSSDALKYPLIEDNFRKIVTEDMTPYLTSIKAPVLILWGEKDADTPVAHARLLGEKIKGSRLVVFPDMTHGLPLKDPEGVYREMEKFI